MNLINYPPPLLAAIKLAENSTYKHRHGAVLVKHGRIVGRGINSIRHHKYSKFYPYPCSCHAETAAILDCRTSLRNSVLYTARINTSSFYRNGSPCLSCRNLLYDLGIRVVIYTTNNGFAKEKLC